LSELKQKTKILQKTEDQNMIPEKVIPKRASKFFDK